MRIYELAKQKNVSSKDVVQLLEKHGFSVTNHMSVVTDKIGKFLEQHFADDIKTEKKNSKEKKLEASVDNVKQKKNSTNKSNDVKKVVQKSISSSKGEQKKENIIKKQNNKNAEAPLSSIATQDQKRPEKDVFATDNPDILNLLDSARNFSSAQGTGSRSGRTVGHGKSAGGERPRRRRSRKSYQRKQERAQRAAATVPRVVTEIILRGDLVLEEAARLLGKQPAELIVSLLRKGMACTRNHILSKESVADLAHQYGIKVIEEKVSLEETDHVSKVFKQKGVERWPIVVVVGHVDHGKTTFLDHIRKADVASKEKGGITQHIGAYEVESEHGKIVFLDTPGHEAFSFLRARGIKVTDIAILMVAADDGVMPQTIEAIKAAQDAGVTIIVAINKIDKVSSPAAIESVKRELAQQDILVEDWGGSVVCAPISAKTGQGISELLEMITLQASMMDLKADPEEVPRAFVLESRLDKGYGPVATVILVAGTLKVGDHFFAGETTGKVRLLLKSNGDRVTKIGPSVPIQVIGFDKFAPLGEWLQVINAKEYSKIRSGRSSIASVVSGSSTFTPMFQENQEKDDQIVRVIIKVDTHGTSEAISRIIATLSKHNKEVARRLQIINISIGDVSESDILFAQNVNARIIGLHVKVERNAQSIAKEKKINVALYSVIYHLTEGLESLIQESRQAVLISEKVGEAIVRKVFTLKNNTAIAGCYVTDGKIPRNGKVVCFRKDKKIGEGNIVSLQRDKKSVKEVNSGYECGFLTDQFHNWQEGDTIQCFVEKKEVPKS